MQAIIRVHWCAAHRLVGHPKCGNVHGHNYTAEIAISGFRQASGMVLDFDRLKAEIDPFVAQWDHAFVCVHDDPIGRLLAEHGQRVVLLAHPPTAEVLATEIKLAACSIVDRLRAAREVPSVTRPDYVQVWETPDFAGRA